MLEIHKILLVVAHTCEVDAVGSIQSCLVP